MTKQQAISLMIAKAMQENGGDLQAAFDSVLGEGAYQNLAGEVWEALQPSA